MCKVKILNENLKKVVILFKNGETISSQEWFEDNTERTNDCINKTVKEAEEIEKLLIRSNKTESDIEKWNSYNMGSEEDTFYISTHALKRLKERNGWNKNASIRMMKKVFDNGTNIESLNGTLKHYLKGRISEPGNSGIVYGDYVYILSNQILLTAYHIPTKSICKKCLKWEKNVA